MIEATIARRYARALFDLSVTENRVEEVRAELESFGALARDHPPLLDVLSNRFLNVPGRLAVIDELGGKLKLSDTVVHFLKLLVKKGRVSLLPPIVSAHRRLAFEHQKIAEAHLKSASPVSPAFKEAVTSLLRRATGKKIVLHEEVNEKLLGGVWLKIGNTVYDGTVRAGLAQLKNRMMQSAF